jgi:hypothetical protein
MKGILFYLLSVLILLCIAHDAAPGQDTVSPPVMKSNFSGNFYLIPGDFFILPVYKGDLDWFHLEMRYNYEERHAFSVWYGCNFSGGGKFRYIITPMVGGIIGNLNGVAPGLEITFGFYGFEFYSESEYVFNLDSKENNFYYNWTDFSYSPLDWMWFGVSIQRTRLYQTNLDIQRGLLIGGGYKWIGLNGYLYNLGWDDPYFILSLSLDF